MKRSAFISFLYLPVFFAAACLKQDHKAPAQLSNDPVPARYKSIAELQQMMPANGTLQIKEAIVISGIVIADDRSGNFYKQVIIDDGTAAIPVLLDAYNLYADFPEGRKLTIYCKGLYTGYYYRSPRLGYLPDAYEQVQPIPALLFDRYLVKGSYGHKVQPVKVLAEDAARAQKELRNRLISVQDVQVADTLQASYALPPELSPATHTRIIDCDSHMLHIRTSGYCNFQSKALPKGRGTLTAIYTVFNNSAQLVLRDTTDMPLHQPRCR